MLVLNVGNRTFRFTNVDTRLVVALEECTDEPEEKEAEEVIRAEEEPEGTATLYV